MKCHCACCYVLCFRFYKYNGIAYVSVCIFQNALELNRLRTRSACSVASRGVFEESARVERGARAEADGAREGQGRATAAVREAAHGAARFVVSRLDSKRAHMRNSGRPLKNAANENLLA